MKQPPFLNLLILGCFTVLGLALILIGGRLSVRGESVLGRPTISKPWFYAGKVGVFACWLFMIVKATFPKSFEIPSFPGQDLVSLIILAVGTAMMIAAFYYLGEALRVGLPEQDTRLSTRGIYRFSRNPLYVGVFLVNLASMVFCPVLLNVFMGLGGIFIHHFIILGEEQFLESRFGEAWTAYRKRTPRYLFL
jgi:protein-S-isoprenylcysteine O-methyltransferase Ste14